MSPSQCHCLVWFQQSCMQVLLIISGCGTTHLQLHLATGQYESTMPISVDVLLLPPDDFAFVSSAQSAATASKQWPSRIRTSKTHQTYRRQVVLHLARHLTSLLCLSVRLCKPDVGKGRPQLKFVTISVWSSSMYRIFIEHYPAGLSFPR